VLLTTLTPLFDFGFVVGGVVFPLLAADLLKIDILLVWILLLELLDTKFLPP
jgi:hypothetical protein